MCTKKKFDLSIFFYFKLNICRIQIHKDEQLCSVRATVATFIIIIILIIVAGVSVGIVFAATKSQNSSGTGGNTNQNSCM
jgi:heme/copper-type cytochrome/quinol oxidase subunit 2